MKTTLPICFLLLSSALATPVWAQTSPAPKTDKEKLSYALGLTVSSQLKQPGLDLDQPMFLNAIRDGFSGATPQMSPDEARQVMMAFSQQMQAKRQAKAAGAKAEGQAFLDANKSKPGVVTLPDGLQYKVIKEGTGPMPAASDTVTVDYRGTLIDGTVFDASDKHGGPATFGVAHLIPGWTEALQKMKVGSKWQLFVPSDLAYGTHGQGADIPPDTMLIFDIELHSIAGK